MDSLELFQNQTRGQAKSMDTLAEQLQRILELFSQQRDTPALTPPPPPRKLDLPIFQGDEEFPRAYLEQVECVLRHNEIPKEYWTIQLRQLSFKGKAASWVDSFPFDVSYDELRTAFMHRYLGAEHCCSVMDRLVTLQQGSMSTEELVFLSLKLNRELSTPLSEAVLIENIQQSLRPECQAVFSSQIPKNIQELRDTARLIDMLFEPIQDPSTLTLNPREQLSRRKNRGCKNIPKCHFCTPTRMHFHRDCPTLAAYREESRN